MRGTMRDSVMPWACCQTTAGVRTATGRERHRGVRGTMRDSVMRSGWAAAGRGDVSRVPLPAGRGSDAGWGATDGARPEVPRRCAGGESQRAITGAPRMLALPPPSSLLPGGAAGRGTHSSLLPPPSSPAGRRWGGGIAPSLTVGPRMSRGECLLAPPSSLLPLLPVAVRKNGQGKALTPTPLHAF